jgi:hypothetical protein
MTTRYLRRAGAAAYLRDTYGARCSHTYLDKLACIGGGPTFHRFGKWPIYEVADLDAWAMSRMTGPLRKASDVPEAHTVGSDATGVDAHHAPDAR